MGLADKLFLLIEGLLVCLLVLPVGDLLLPVLIALSLSAITSWQQDPRVRLAAWIVYAIVCAVLPGLLCFLPLLAFDQWGEKPLPAPLAVVPAAIILGPELGWIAGGATLFMTAYSCFVALRRRNVSRLRSQTLLLRDRTQELALQLEARNRELLGKQEYDVRLATLRERNRIAREIHDSVGHQLTRALLVTGAALTEPLEPAAAETLSSIRDMLSESMDSIRRSVHDLHEGSTDLADELQVLIDGFSFCPVELHYACQDAPPRAAQIAFLAICREALANVARHSGASRVTVRVREQPGLYQLVIHDNGRGLPARLLDDPTGESRGLGLRNIQDRIRQLGGQVSFRNEGGLVVFCSVPRQAERKVSA